MSAKTANLTPAQATLVHRLATESMGYVEYRKGGFWTARETIANADGVPDWWVQTQTITALARKGVLEESARRSWGVCEYRLTPEWRVK